MAQFDKVPEEIKELKAWVCWKKEVDPSRPNGFKKLPINPSTGFNARSNEPLTWTDFDTAYNKMQAMKYDGIGFMFSGTGYVGIDIDHCMKDGELSDFAQEIISTLHSYTEVSPSGEGIHIICRGTMPTGGNRNDSKGLEMYTRGRYFTVTGNVLQGYETICGCQDEIEAVHNKHIKKQKNQTSGNATLANNQKILVSPKDNKKMVVPNDNQAIIELASRSKQGDKFMQLYNGNWQGVYESHSQADQGFCNMLAFWTRCDDQQMDSIFRESGLMRDKWDEMHGVATYGSMTITKAIDDCTNMYEPRIANFKNNKREDCTTPQLNDFPVLDGKSRPLKKHWKNTEWLCNSLNICFRLNELTKQVEVNLERFKELSFDAIITEMMGICHENDFKILRADLIDHIGRIAEKNKYNPVRDFLNECKEKWDGESRIRRLFDCFVLNPEIPHDEELIFTLFKKWLVSCVIMAFNDGTKAAQGSLILNGGQGIGKTRWIFYILPDETWGKEGVSIDFKQKDDLIRAVSYWIVELGEIGSTMRREKIDRLKAFITDKTDAIRMPYGRAMERRPRNTVFIGTVNNDEFLKDDTGERRNWIVPLLKINFDMELDMRQMWGEVTHLALVEEYPYWITEDEIKALNEQNEVYKVATPEEQLLLDVLDWDCKPEDWLYINATQMCKALDLPSSRNIAIGRALKRLSSKGIKPPNNHRFKRYYCPTFKDSSLRHSALFHGATTKKEFRDS